MNKNGKAPASVYQTQVEARAETSGALISYDQDTTTRAEKQGKIAALLPRGEANAVSTRDLLKLSGYNTARRLQKAIEAERAAGALILSSSAGGYFLPAEGEAGRAEIVRYMQTLHARAIHTLRTLRTARRALREVYGQEEIDGVKR